MKFYLFLFKLIVVTTIVFALIIDGNAAPFVLNGQRFNKTVKPLKEIKREHIVIQSLDFSCGAAGISTLMNYYLNDPIQEKDIIAQLLKTVPLKKVMERKGFSLYDLKSFAQNRGYKATGYKMDMDYLRNLDIPVLVPIKFKKYRHFVVVKKVLADRVFIADPAAGNISMKVEQFNRIWTDGIALVVESKASKKTTNFAHVKKHDFLISDYKNIRSLVNPDLIRINFYPNEW